MEESKCVTCGKVGTEKEPIYSHPKNGGRMESECDCRKCFQKKYGFDPAKKQ